MKELKIGRLSKEPELKEVKLSDGESKKVCNVNMFVRDPYAPKDDKGYQAGIPIRLTAWGERALQLSKCSKGEIITVIGTTAAVTHSNSDYPSYGLRVSSMYRNDEAFKINKQMTTLLNSFEKGEVSCIFDIETSKIVEDVAQIPQHEEEIENEAQIDNLDKTLEGYEKLEDYEDFEEFI